MTDTVEDFYHKKANLWAAGDLQPVPPFFVVEYVMR